MAVYTSISAEELHQLLTDFELGTLVHFEGIEGGIENTNYFVNLELRGQKKSYVLTIFEELSLEEMPFFVELGHWLAERSIPVPYAIRDRNGIALKQLKGKPAVLQPRFYGTDVPAAKLRPIHCFQIGEALARFHQAGSDFYLKRQAHRGVFWWRRESEAIAHRLTPEDAALLKQEVAAFDRLRDAELDLPTGVIHGDLFHDNALFKDDKLEAILDMYNAATAYQLYDLAIVANDWCNRPDHSIDAEREAALLEGYAQIRPFTRDEAKAWPVLTRTAAMRFWLSRLIPWLGIAQASRQGGEMKLKDPDQYKQILLSRIHHPAALR
ncbi:MAG: homoserine kinase [Nitrincola lacisaponensis]|uniref:homoserine kinase n=1 Tax=Nitrincola lacisaponensis TaxID=267850 RepID=UPI00391CD58B